jgi:membrane associated rhomboid family serine protease
MATSNRNYIRVGPRASSGLGNLRVISFNTWLIILNVAVFLVNNHLLNTTALLVPTSMGQEFDPSTTAAQQKRGKVIDTVGPHPTIPGWYFKPIIDPDNGQFIGRDRFTSMPVLESVGHFSTAKAFVPGFQVWRFISFQFLHYNWIHLLFNMLGLWFVGGMVEQHLGFKRYAAFYLTCGIFGALFYLLLNFLGFLVTNVAHLGPVHIPGLLFNDVYTPLIGASAGVFGVLIAAARLEPMATVWVYFLIPVRLRTAVVVLVLITLFNLFSGAHNAGGEAAHVGGIIAGFYFIRRLYLLRDFFDVLGNSRLPEKTPAGPAASPSPVPLGAADMEAEIERILAKSEQQGILSLSEGERRLLREYNELMQRG